MALVGILVLILAFFNPPQIFWIMYFGGTVIASAWGVVAIASVWMKDMSESSAFYGMLLGFLGCVITKSISAFMKIALPIYLDPFFIGIVLSILGIVIGKYISKATLEDIARFNALHVRPSNEQDVLEDKKTHSLMWVYMAFAILLGLVFVLAYAIPYINAKV